MCRSVRALISAIDGMAAGADEHEAGGILDDFVRQVGVHELCSELGQWLSDPSTRDSVGFAARETSTHYVWPLYVNGAGHSLVLHEFKSFDQKPSGYAATLHDHRYSFATIVLRGGYQQFVHSVSIPSGEQFAQIEDLRYDWVVEGQVVAVNHRDFHRLAEIQDDTFTLLIKCPPVKEFSVSVDIDTLRVRTHVPVEARVLALVNALSQVSPQGTGGAGHDA